MEDYDSLQKLSSQLGAHTINLTSTDTPRSLKLIRYIYGELCSAGFLSWSEENHKISSEDLQKVFSSKGGKVAPSQQQRLRGNQTSGSTPTTLSALSQGIRCFTARYPSGREPSANSKTSSPETRSAAQDASPRKKLLWKRYVYLWGAGLQAKWILMPQGSLTASCMVSMMDRADAWV